MQQQPGESSENYAEWKSQSSRLRNSAGPSIHHSRDDRSTGTENRPVVAGLGSGVGLGGLEVGCGGRGGDGCCVWTVSVSAPCGSARCYHWTNWVKGSLQAQNWKCNWRKIFRAIICSSAVYIHHALWIRVISYQMSMCLTDLEIICGSHKS